MKLPEQIPIDANKVQVRELVRGLRDYLESIQPKVIVVEELPRVPAPYSNTPPKIESKCHIHPNSNKLVIMRDNTTRLISQLTEEERLFIEEDAPGLLTGIYSNETESKQVTENL